MNNIQRNPNERGSAILLVLGFLSLLLMMAMIFAVTSRNAQIVADAKADETAAQLQARSAATQAEEVLFFLQNKGNIIGKKSNNILGEGMPGKMNIEQSPTELSDKEYYYGTPGSANSDMLGLQPYVGFLAYEGDSSLLNPYRFLGYYGELSKDKHANTPFGIETTEPTDPYQSIYYSHNWCNDPDNQDEVVADGENSLYQIVKNTTLGAAYFEATGGDTGEFAKLLAKDVKNQLQFRNVIEKSVIDEKYHVVTRQGFIVFCEGSKFNLNCLISSPMDGTGNEKEPGLPMIGSSGSVSGELGAITMGVPSDTPNVGLKPGWGNYEIMGRKYNDNEYTSNKLKNVTIVENETVQYGLHPQELQTRQDSSKNAVYLNNLLARNNNSKPPRWFNYAQMLAISSVKNSMLSTGDLFLYGLNSGTDDRELRFNGQYQNMADLLDSIGETTEDGQLKLTNSKINNLNDVDDCSFLAKANIAFPWGIYCKDATCSKFGSNPSWDDISSKLESFTGNFEDYSKHFFKCHLGLKEDKLFLSDSGDKDLTPQVFANLVDFCDSDDKLTYLATVGTDKLKFDTTGLEISTVSSIKTVPSPVINPPEICGNEKTLAVVGVKVDFDLASSTVSVHTENGGTSATRRCKMTVNGGDIDFSPTITLSLQNLFNEDLSNKNNDIKKTDKERKYRVIVEGEIVPIILAGKGSYALGSITNALIVGDSPLVLSSTTDYFLSVANLKDNKGGVRNKLESESRYFRIDKTFTTTLSGKIPKLQNVLLSEAANNLRFHLGNKTYGQTFYDAGGNHYYFKGSGYAVKVTKIVVMGQESSGGLSELAYMEGDTWVANWLEVYSSLGTADTNYNYALPITNSGRVVVEGATCRDPRMNHKKDQWVWLSDTSRPSRTVSVPYENGLLTRGYDSTTWAKYSMETVENALKNSSSSTQKDWEPDFNPGNMNVVSGRSTMGTTLSTFYIPNAPISSLWQLGAVHRGEEGRTINLKKFGTSGTSISHKYTDGDAWILDYLKLNELDPNHSIQGKFNPNCFNASSYRFLFANIPANEPAEDTMVYANGFFDSKTDDVQRNTFYKKFILGETPGSDDVDLETKVFRFKFSSGPGKTKSDLTAILKAQSWSPVQAFFNFVEVDGGARSTGETYKCNDRQAESLIGCTAGLLSTRYEVFTAIVVGQAVKYLEDITDTEMNNPDIKKQLANPLKLYFRNPSTGNTDNEWYSILSTQVREVTFVRDCWFGKIKVLKSRLL